jgi:hypothetical protein
MKNYLPDIVYHYYYYTYNALARMAKLYGVKHEE